MPKGALFGVVGPCVRRMRARKGVKGNRKGAKRKEEVEGSQTQTPEEKKKKSGEGEGLRAMMTQGVL